MKKEKFYWKVVRKDINNKFLSVILLRGKYCLEYIIGKEIIAPKQGVFVFNTRDQARSYRQHQYDLFEKDAIKILKVKATGKEIKKPIFYDLWKLEANEIRKSLTSSFPSGTRCFKSIIPFEISH